MHRIVPAAAVRLAAKPLRRTKRPVARLASWRIRAGVYATAAASPANAAKAWTIEAPAGQRRTVGPEAQACQCIQMGLRIRRRACQDRYRDAAGQAADRDDGQTRQVRHHNVREDFMKEIAAGTYSANHQQSTAPMGSAAQSYLTGYNSWWQTANAWVCGDKVLVC